MQRYLRISLLLQITNDTLSDEIAAADDLEHLVIIFADEGQLEAIFRRIDGDSFWPSRTVEAVNNLALHASEVHGLIKSFDDSVVAERVQREDDVYSQCYSPLGQSVFDVV